MRLALITIALLAVFAAASAAAAPAPERLIMRPYPGSPAWKRITDQANATQWLHEQIPADQTVDNFTDILTDDGFRAMAGRDPMEFLKVDFDGYGKSCASVRIKGPTAASEGGLPVAYGQIFCTRRTGTDYGVVVFYKVIGGAEALYSVSREFHIPPATDGGLPGFPEGQTGRAEAFVAAEKVANDYLIKDVYLCGGASTDRRCAR